VEGVVPWEWFLPYSIACRTLFFDNLVGGPVKRVQPIRPSGRG